MNTPQFKKAFAKLKSHFNLVGVSVVLITIVVGCLTYLVEPLPLKILRNTVFDQYQRWQPRQYQPQPVHIIDIDDASLARLGQWPWPRTRIAELTSRLQSAGAASIGFDVIFAEHDRTSPKTMIDLWKLSPDGKKTLENLPDHDAVMAETLTQGKVILGFSVGQENSPGKLPETPFKIISVGESPLPFLHGFSSSIMPLPEFETKASGIGALTFIPDSDGVVRRVPLMIKVNEQPMPTFSAESLRVAQHESNYLTRTARTAGTGIQEIRIGKITIPTTPTGEVWVYYTTPVAERYIPAWKVLAGEVDQKLLKDSILLIGTSAQGLMDLRLNTRGIIMPGVEAHAQVLEQILGNTYLQRPAWAGSIEVLVIILGGLLVGLLSLASSALVSFICSTLLLGGIGWGAWMAFSNYGLLLDPVTPSLGVLAVSILASAVHHFMSERKQRWVKEAFSRYVSPNLVSHLVDNPNQLELGGQRRECSFIFTDLAGFTSLMEKIDPAEAVSLLNVYLDKMIAIAFRHQGTLDRIVGDAIAIVFSAPVVQADHRQRALDCALEMDEFATRYSAEIRARGIAFGITRFGIHSGEVIVGNFGGSTIFDYRALGDPVNTASRLESVNKHLGTRVCVSEMTLAGCEDANVRPVGQLVLKGKSQPLMVYQPITAHEDMRAEDRAYASAFGLLREGKPEALAAFEALAAKYPQDPLVALHLGRLRTGATNDLIVMAEK